MQSGFTLKFALIFAVLLTTSCTQEKAVHPTLLQYTRHTTPTYIEEIYAEVSVGECRRVNELFDFNEYNFWAPLLIGRMYEEGVCLEQSYEKSYDHFLSVAGDLYTANIRLGYYHEAGIGRPRDMEKAKEFYDLAKLWLNNWDTTEDVVNDIELIMYPYPIPSEFQKHIDWYETILAGGPKAYFEVGKDILETAGEDARKKKRALYWLKDAWRNDYHEAGYYMGKEGLEGKLTDVLEPLRAVMYIRYAIGDDYFPANLYGVELMLEGKYLRLNYRAAYAMLWRAKRMGELDVKALLDKVTPHLTLQQMWDLRFDARQDYLRHVINPAPYLHGN